MKSISTYGSPVVSATIISLAGSLLISNPAGAHGADVQRMTMRQARLANPDLSRHELRQTVRSANPIRNGAVDSSQFRTQNFLPQNNEYSYPIIEPVVPNPPRHTQIVDGNGKGRSIRKGLELNLTSSERSIVLGESLFTGSSSYSIDIGEGGRSLTSGSIVSPAEFVALGQVIDEGHQSLVIDRSGRGAGGQFSLSNIDDAGRSIRASSLVVPENVSAVGNFGRSSDFRLTGDLVNYGKVYAASDGPEGNRANIVAHDIVNHQDATISSVLPPSVETSSTIAQGPVDLHLSASNDLSNFGTISSSGTLTLEAGGHVHNAGSASAQSNVSIQSSTILNSGFITSVRSDVTLSTPTATNMSVNNTGGTINALNGNINIREEGYSLKNDTILLGGDFNSQKLNLNAGDGVIDASVRNVTGEVISNGYGVHFESESDRLIIGDTNLVDPTFRNHGDIVIGGDITVGESLAIIASLNILMFQGASSKITAAGDITLIAGANILDNPNTDNIPTGTIGPIPPPGLPGVSTTIDKGSTEGGLMLLEDIEITATGGGGNAPGNIFLAAFKGTDSQSGQIALTLGNNAVITSDGGEKIELYAPVAIFLGGLATSIKGTTSTVDVILQTAHLTNTAGGVTYDKTGAIQSGTWSTTGITPDGYIALCDITTTGDIDIAAGTQIVNSAALVSTKGAVSMRASEVTFRQIDANQGVIIESTTKYREQGEINNTFGDVQIKLGSKVEYDFDRSIFNNVGGGLGDIIIDVPFFFDGAGSKSTLSAPFGDVKINGGFITTPENGSIIAEGISLNSIDSSVTVFGTVQATKGDLDISGKGAVTLAPAAVVEAKNGDINITSVFEDNALPGLIVLSAPMKAAGTIFMKADGLIAGDSLLTCSGLTAISSVGVGTSSDPVLFTNDAGPVTVAAQAISGSVNIEHTGTGSVTLESSSLNIDFELVSASGSGVIVNGNVSGTGLFSLRTDSLTNSKTISFASIAVSSNPGDDLIVNGLSGGTYNASTTSLNATDQDLEIFGTNTFNGNAVFSNLVEPLNSIHINPNSVVGVNGDLTLNTCNFENDGILNVTGTTTINCSNTKSIATLVNSSGDVDFSGNFVFNGKNFAVIASGDIKGTGTSFIDLSSIAGQGGSFFAFAGASISPDSGGQVFDGNTKYIISGASSTGGDINLPNVLIDTSSLNGAGGSVQMYALAGSKSTGFINVGAVDSAGATKGGGVQIFASGAITTGTINTIGGLDTDGNVDLSTSAPLLASGTVQIFDGTPTGTVTPGANSNSIINYDTITAGTGTANIFGNLGTPPVGTVNANVVNLVSLGNIGGASRLNINASIFSANASGNVFLFNQNSNLSTIIAGSGGVFDLFTAGSLNVDAPINGGDLILKTNGAFGIDAPLTGSSTISLTQNAFLSNSNVPATLLNTPRLFLRTSNGQDIGTPAVIFEVGPNVGEIRVNTTGSAYVGSLSFTGVEYGQTVVGGDLFLGSQSGLTVTGAVTNAEGDIVIGTASGILRIDDFVPIIANSVGSKGNIQIINLGQSPVKPKDNDFIQFGVGSSLEALADNKPGGRILVQLGEVKDSKIKPLKEKTLAKAGIFFTLNNGVLVGAPSKPILGDPDDPSFINVTNTSVTLLSEYKKNVTMEGGVTFEADPPPGQSAVLASDHSNLDSVLSSWASLSNAGSARESLDRTHLNYDAPSNQVSSEISPISALPLAPIAGADATRFNLVQLDNASLTRSNLALVGLITGMVEPDEDSSSLNLSDTQENDPGHLSYRDELNAYLCTDLVLGVSDDSGTGITMKPHSKIVSMNDGSTLFVPSTDMTVVTPKGTIRLAAKSVALIAVDQNHLTVYDINDSHKRSITVEVSGRTLSLSPGAHVTVTSKRISSYCQINPVQSVMHRGLSTHDLSDDQRAFTSEFSIPSAVRAVRPLRAMLGSKSKSAREAASRIVKTSAIVMQLSQSAVPFEIHARPTRVASR